MYHDPDRMQNANALPKIADSGQNKIILATCKNPEGRAAAGGLQPKSKYTHWLQEPRQGQPPHVLLELQGACQWSPTTQAPHELIMPGRAPPPVWPCTPLRLSTSTRHKAAPTATRNLKIHLWSLAAACRARDSAHQTSTYQNSTAAVPV